MLTLNAILRAKLGAADALAGALAEMTRYVSENEPGTISFFVGRDVDNPDTFVTYERFADRAAMEAHNTSSYRDEWVDKYGGLLDGDIVRYICDEVAAKES